MVYFPTTIEYSDKYYDHIYEYRHVILTKDLLKKIPKDKLLREEEWRELGIQQSRGWVHYCIYKKEPHVLLFRRPIGTNPESGIVPEEIQVKVDEWEKIRVDVV